MTLPHLHELQEAIAPITSLISKSEKSLQKLTPGTWQHTMLLENLRALQIALALMNSETSGADAATRDDLQAALRAFAAMISRSEKALAKFAPETSQYSLLQNRLKAFRTAEILIKAELK